MVNTDEKKAYRPRQVGQTRKKGGKRTKRV
jgi:hypothetical protein